MADEPPSSSDDNKQSGVSSWLDRMLSGFSAEPRSREELLDIIKRAVDNKVVDTEALSIIEGALDVAQQQVREIMVPRSQMVVIKEEEKPEEFLPKVIDSGHSRFPVIGETSGFSFDAMLRPANIIPESKRLNVLLKEFRENRYHMAIVIDEYGGISGLLTIEDILEEIVGEIEDETDDDDNEDFIRQVSENDYILKALTPIEEFNSYFQARFTNEEFDTIGGLVMQAFGHLPGRNECVDMGHFSFRVLYSDSRKIHLLRVSKNEKKKKKKPTKKRA